MNLDTYDDVAKDYRFYEDPGDEFRNPPDGVSAFLQAKQCAHFRKAICSFLNRLIVVKVKVVKWSSQVLLPLWNFALEEVVGLEVTQLQWSSKYLGKWVLTALALDSVGPRTEFAFWSKLAADTPLTQTPSPVPRPLWSQLRVF